MRKIFLPLLAFIFLAGEAAFPAAGACEDELEDLQDEMAREMAAYLGEVAEDQLAFRDERDRDFAEFLQEQWKEFDEFAGLVADRTPKPVRVPKVEKAKDTVQPAGRIIESPAKPVDPPPSTDPPKPVPKPAPAEPMSAPVPQLVPENAQPRPAPSQDKSTPPAPPQIAPPSVQPPPVPVPIPAKPEPPASVRTPDKPVPVPAPMPAGVPEPVPPAVPAVEKPVSQPIPEKAERPSKPETTPIRSGPAVEFVFYGKQLQVPCDPALRAQLVGAPGNQTIAAYWKEVSAADFSPTIEQLGNIREQLQLNDWGYYQLAMQTAEAVHASANEATLFCWFLLSKSAYKAKVGYSGATVYLLVPTAQILYGIPYYTLEEVRYYNFSYIKTGEKPGRLFTYQDDYPGADKPVRMLLEKIPLVRQESATRPLKFSYGGSRYEIPVTYNPNAVRFLGSYPQADLPVFFTAALEPAAEKSLLELLARIIAGKSETEAVNILLRFVQTAFEYKTDEEQFGREKYLFAEETLYFPYSDCEDRSILFSYLVRRLTGLEVVGLHYPGHIATAVGFSEKVAGDQLKIGDRPYVICDPTYINADIGMAMPQFKDAKPEVIRFGI